jgi:hypothetical protein
MADRYADYREQAAYCERMSLRAPTPELREDWLRLAGRWLAMLPHKESPKDSPQKEIRSSAE